MINICMCDDNPILLEKYSTILNSVAAKEGITISINLFNSGEMLIKYFEGTLDKIDIIYSDILMGGLNGIETARVLRKSGCSAEIIFLTSSQDFVFDAFAVNPLHYMSKFDIDVDKFTEVFLKAVSFASNKETNHFTIIQSGDTVKIPLEDILYFKKNNTSLSVQCQHTSFTGAYSIDTVGEDLKEKNFIFSHPHFLINLSKVKKVTNDSVLMINGDDLPLESDSVNYFKSALSNCLANSF